MGTLILIVVGVFWGDRINKNPQNDGTLLWKLAEYCALGAFLLFAMSNRKTDILGYIVLVILALLRVIINMKRSS